ncbi:hypothetical protein IW152_002995 [Coemansia sp. BCRC 34962]|nr:hypothetical protein IW152_002995 [Coemansia sp. BCRC 34962]
MAAEKCTLIPEQLFDSQDAFISHVKHFALENGFNVRLDDVERDKGGSIRKRDIVCSSEGAPRGKESANKREDSVCRSDIEDSEPMTPTKTSSLAHSGAHRRKSMKTGCRWLARASRQSSGMWKMIMLRLEHNHPLTTRYELFQPSSHVIRTGDDTSISHATSAARAALMNGTYRGPSLEFKNLFLQMTAACADLCWSAARHPETVPEVLSEIRRLNQHLDKHAEHEDYEMHDSRSPRARSVLLPPASENGEGTVANGESIDATNDKLASGSGDSSLVMMGHNINDMINHRISAAQPQPSHFLNVPPHSASQHMEIVMSDSPAQILARSQNRHIAEAQSPELNSTSSISIAVHNGIAPDGALSPTAPSAALSATGPVKRARGRPRKNPVAAGESKSAKSKAQQKRDQLQREQQQQQIQQQQQQQQQQQVQQAPPPTQPTPTPADLASLTHQIINQNAASSPANVQRSIGTSLALPSQPVQMHSHHGSRASMIGAGGNVPSILDTRSHANPVQRQQQGPSSRATISDPATNAPAPVDAPTPGAEQRASGADANGYWPPSSGRSRAAAAGSAGERDGSRLAKARLVSKAMVIDPGATSADSPHLSTVNPIAPTFPSYPSYQQQQQQQSYYNYQQQQRMEQQYHGEQPPEAAVGVGSPPVSAISQLVISSSSTVPGATGYSQSTLVGAASAPNAKNGNQRTTAHASHQYHQYQQSHLLHQQQQQHQSQTQQLLQLGSSSMHAATSQMNRDPTTPAAQINPYWIMPRAQQQQQQQQKQPHADHLASASAHHHHQQPPATVLSSLPPMAHGGDVLPGAGRRLDELQLNQYQSWQM